MRAPQVAAVACLLILHCNALNCRSDGGPKEGELKTVYMNCAKRQDGKNSSEVSSRGSWGERRGNQDERPARGRDDGNSRGRDDGMRGREDNGMSQSDEYSRDMSRYNNYNSNNNYRTSTQSSRRYKRERRTEMNSGHRSQYNPNTSHRNSGYEDAYKRDERNSSENATRGDSCVLHCFLEELEMTDDSGMPDRYMVTNVITKNVQNEDLKDFLQESIEECFQILYNENTQDKCSFSRNLMMCLSEKGKANCDDWKDDIQF